MRGGRAVDAGSRLKSGRRSRRGLLTRRDNVYWTLRQTLVLRHEDLELCDRLFGEWFELLGGRATVAVSRRRTRGQAAADALGGVPSASRLPPASEEGLLGWSPHIANNELLVRVRASYPGRSNEGA